MDLVSLRLFRRNDPVSVRIRQSCFDWARLAERIRRLQQVRSFTESYEAHLLRGGVAGIPPPPNSGLVMPEEVGLVAPSPLVTPDVTGQVSEHFGLGNAESMMTNIRVYTPPMTRANSAVHLPGIGDLCRHDSDPKCLIAPLTVGFTDRTPPCPRNTIETGPVEPPTPAIDGYGPHPRPTPVKQQSCCALLRNLLPSWAFGYKGAIRVKAAEVKADFIKASYDEEPEAKCYAKLSLTDILAAKASGKYNQYHRASNRWHKRLATLRELREILLFESSEVRRIRSTTNETWVGINARKVVTKAVESGKVDKRHAQWYRAALNEVFFIEDDDDEFLAALRTSCVRAY